MPPPRASATAGPIARPGYAAAGRPCPAPGGPPAPAAGPEIAAVRRPDPDGAGDPGGMAAALEPLAGWPEPPLATAFDDAPPAFDDDAIAMAFGG